MGEAKLTIVNASAYGGVNGTATDNSHRPYGPHVEIRAVPMWMRGLRVIRWIKR